MQQASELNNVQKKLGCDRAALGSLSEAATVFDPERPVEIIQELNGQLTPTHGGKDPRLANLPGGESPGDTDVSRRPDHPMRLVVVKIRPHVSGGKYKGGSSGVDSDDFLRIATNLHTLFRCCRTFSRSNQRIRHVMPSSLK